MKKIFIDCGHNPSRPDTGAEGNGLKEQDVTYNVGTVLAKKLKAVGFDVKLSRETPTEVLGKGTLASSLAARVDKANAWKADLFISLHTDSSIVPDAKGAHIRMFNTKSVYYKLAKNIIETMITDLDLNGRSDTIVEDKALYVLRKTEMPAMLIEMGFISNPDNARLMKNPDVLAHPIFKGICSYSGIKVAPELISINDIVWELANRGIVTNKGLWLKKLSEDANDYWLARKLINYIIQRGM